MSANRFIDDARNWAEMDGDTDLEKKINSILTHRFIWTKDVPTDECLVEAKHLVGMFNHGCSEDEVAKYLAERFRTPVGEEVSPVDIARTRPTAEKVLQVFGGAPWS